MPIQLVVPRSGLTPINPIEVPARNLDQGEVRLRVARFGLTANNITYGLFGDAMGYWSFFPVDDEFGCIPVWGFGEVIESKSVDIPVGERLFGYFPMGEELIIHPVDASEPADAGELVVVDGSPHRAHLHAWYNRYYRCANDPLWRADTEPMQAVMWPLFMTGWVLANELAASVSTLLISSASSKTSISAAWTASQEHDGVSVVGLTSAPNVGQVEGLGIYDRVLAYDALEQGLTDSTVGGPAAFVDTAGNTTIREQVHRLMGNRLVDSLRLGATHQSAGGPPPPLPGPDSRRFFIPDVAEDLAREQGFAHFHHHFAEAWQRFEPWIASRLVVAEWHGKDDIVAVYDQTRAGDVSADRANVLCW